MPKPTRARANELVETPKIASATVSWKNQPNDTWRLKIKIFSIELREVLELRGYVGRSNYSFVLLYQNYPIRKYTKHFRHITKKGERVYKPHKHTWDKETEDDDFYIPSNIDPQSDLNVQFLAFCEECNITLQEGSYQHAAFQLK